MLRATLKRLLEIAGTAGPLPRWSRRWRRGARLVLSYHNIVPRGGVPGGDRSLHLCQADFAEQLDVVRALFSVRSLADLSIDGGSLEPAVAITFDDAYVGALTAGVEELERRGLPATFFVAPGCLGGQAFWWDILGAMSPAGLDPATRATALEAHRGETAAIREWKGLSSDDRLPPMPASALTADEGLLRRVVVRTSRFSLASHSWSHPNLARLSGERLQQELCKPREWLEASFAGTDPVLAYPYGLANTEVLRAVRSAGYQAAYLVSGGWWRGAPESPFALPRLNVPAGISIEGFMLRLMGFFGGTSAVA